MQLPPLHDHEIHVWQFRLDLSAATVEALARLLAPDEVERAGQMRRRAVRDRFVVGRAVLRLLLAQYAKTSPRNLELAIGPHGKPYMVAQSPINFNLAHSEVTALLAAARESEVGVDIEQLREIKELTRLSEEYMTTDELAFMNSGGGDERLARFFRLWTRKEACLKAMGSGISGALSRVETAAHPGFGLYLATGGKKRPESRWRVWDFESFGHPASIAVCDLSPEWQLSFSELSDVTIDRLAATQRKGEPKDEGEVSTIRC